MPVSDFNKLPQGTHGYKGPVILAIDPAFKKCGFAIISKDTGKYIESY